MARNVPCRRLVRVARTALLAAAALGGSASNALALTGTQQPVSHIVCAAGTSGAQVLVGCCPVPPPCRPLTSTTPATQLCFTPQAVIACPLGSSTAQSASLVRPCCPVPVLQS